MTRKGQSCKYGREEGRQGSIPGRRCEVQSPQAGKKGIEGVQGIKGEGERSIRELEVNNIKSYRPLKRLCTFSVSLSTCSHL